MPHTPRQQELQHLWKSGQISRFTMNSEWQAELDRKYPNYASGKRDIGIEKRDIKRDIKPEMRDSVTSERDMSEASVTSPESSIDRRKRLARERKQRQRKKREENAR